MRVAAKWRWVWALAVAVLVGSWLGWAVYRDHYSPAAQARRVAHAFWTSVEAGDQEAAQRLLTSDSPQSASQLVTFLHDYRYDGYASHLNVVRPNEAWLQHGLDFQVITGLISPEEYPRTFILGLKRDTEGSYRVWFVGQGVSAGPNGRIVPTLRTE